MQHVRSFFAVAVLALLSTGANAADTYEIDGSHSSVIFRIKHMGVSMTYGRFNNPTGTLVIDEADAAKSSVSIELKAENIDTFNEKRDQHLKNPDFFNAKQFPLITFKSKAVKKAGEAYYDVTGDLTLLGVTKEFTVTFERIGTGTNAMMGTRTGFEGGFTIKRSDFGMKNMLEAIGDDVKIIVAIEAAKK